MATSNNANNDSNALVFQTLKSWVEKAGGQVHTNLELKNPSSGEGERGLFTTKAIQKGDILLRIPAALAISGEKLPSKFQSRNASPWLRCLACLYLAQDDKHWEPYVKSLPNSYETLWQWTEEHAAYLEGTTLGATLKADRAEGATKQRFEEYVKPYLKHLKIPRATYEVFETTSMCLSTRGFHMQPSEDEDEDKNPSGTPGPYLGPFLLPAIDLLNHTDNPNDKATTLQRDTKTNDFYMIAERDLKQGEEVFHSYGDKLTAAQLLQTFGFVPQSKMSRCTGESANKTPAIFSQQDLVDACTSVKQSSYPQELKDTMEQCEIEGDVFDLPTTTQQRDLSFLPDQSVVTMDDDDGIVSDEIVTLCAIQMLPDDVYQEVGQDLLEAEILEDYFLGKLVAMALLTAIQTKMAKYSPVKVQGLLDNTDDKAILQQLLKLDSERKHDVATRRAMYALTIRLEEKSALEELKKQTISLIASLDDDGDGEDDNALEELLRQRMESRRPAKKQKPSNE